MNHLERSRALKGALLAAAGFLGLGASLALSGEDAPSAAPPQPGTERPPAVAQLVARYSDARLGADAFKVERLALRAGHMRVLVETGIVAPVLAGDETIGLFVEGQGSIEYSSLDTIEYPIMTFNLKKATDLRAEPTEHGLAVRDTLHTLLWYASGQPLPALEGARAASPAAAFEEHRRRFARSLGTPVAHSLTLSRTRHPVAPFVRAEKSGGEEDLVYEYEEERAGRESLWALKRSESEDSEMKKYLWPVEISSQPIGTDPRDPPTAPFLLTDVDYTLVASDGTQAALSVTETLVPQGESRGVLLLDLYNTTYAAAPTGKLVPRHYVVRSVTDEAGRALSFDHSLDEILIGLAEPAPVGRPIKLRFEIDGDFLIRPHGDNFWQLGVEPWLPQPDLAGQSYTIHSVVKVKKPFVAFAPGGTIARRVEGDYNVVENRIDQPVEFAVVLAGKYSYSEETRKGVTVRVASYAARNDRAAKQLTELAFGIIDYYQYFLGPFPFPEFNIIEINQYGYGQAPPGTMFITQEAFQSQIGELNRIYSQGINERFAHEIAHQYWGHVVKMPSFEEQWLTESFAEYSAGLFLKKAKGKATYDKLVATWKSNAKQATDVSPIPLANRIRITSDPFRMFLLRTYLIYDKGAYLLSRIHAGMDDKTFLTFMKSYQKNFRWKFGSTKHVVGLLNFLTGKDYGPFFEANYWGTGMPD